MGFKKDCTTILTFQLELLPIIKQTLQSLDLLSFVHSEAAAFNQNLMPIRISHGIPHCSFLETLLECRPDKTMERKTIAPNKYIH